MEKSLFGFIWKYSARQQIFILMVTVLTYPVVYAWVLDEPMRYEVPIPYVHQQGAVKCVVLKA